MTEEKCLKETVIEQIGSMNEKELQQVSEFLSALTGRENGGPEVE